MSAGGYANAPITLFLSVLTFILSVTVSHRWLELDLNRLYGGEWWRIFTSQFAYRDMGQTIIGLILLYTCRQFERQMGIKKFAAFFTFNLVMSTLMLMGVIVTASSINIPFIPTPGLFSFTFALLTLFYSYIPQLHPSKYSILGMDLSEKSWIYFLSLQLMLSDGLNSVVVALIGILVGFLYRNDGYGFQSYRLPAFLEGSLLWIISFVPNWSSQNSIRPVRNPGTNRNNGNRQTLLGDYSSLMEPFLRQNVPTNGTGRNRFSLQDLAQFHPLDGDENLIANRDNTPEDFSRFIQTEAPREEDIVTLMSLGFERETVIAALRSTGNHVDAAANILFR